MNIDYDKLAVLVGEARKGDMDAFNEVYENTYRLVFKILRGMNLNEEDSEDLVQEVYLTVYQKFDTLDDDKAFISWLKNITANKAKDKLKSMKDNLSYDEKIENEEELKGDDDIDSLPEEIIMEEDKRNTIMRIIKEELSEVQYQTIFMYYYSDIQINNIAEIMEVPEGTVKTRLKNAKIKIKAGIEKYQKEFGVSLAAVGFFPSLSDIFGKSMEKIQVPKIPFQGIPSQISGGVKAGEAIKAGQKAGEALKIGAKEGAKIGKPAGLKVLAGVAIVGVLGLGAALIYNWMKPENKKAPIESDITTTTQSIVETTTAISEETTTSQIELNITTTEETTNNIVELSMGDYVSFGKKGYSDDSEIVWIVDSVTEDDYVLFCTEVLTASRYNAYEYTDDGRAKVITKDWDTSYLKRYVEEQLKPNIFEPSQRQYVKEITIPDKGYGKKLKNNPEEQAKHAVTPNTVFHSSKYILNNEYCFGSTKSCPFWARSNDKKLAIYDGKLSKLIKGDGDDLSGVLPVIRVSKNCPFFVKTEKPAPAKQDKIIFDRIFWSNYGKMKLPNGQVEQVSVPYLNINSKKVEKVVNKELIKLGSWPDSLQKQAIYVYLNNDDVMTMCIVKYGKDKSDVTYKVFTINVTKKKILSEEEILALAGVTKEELFNNQLKGVSGNYQGIGLDNKLRPFVISYKEDDANQKIDAYGLDDFNLEDDPSYYITEIYNNGSEMYMSSYGRFAQ